MKSSKSGFNLINYNGSDFFHAGKSAEAIDALSQYRSSRTEAEKEVQKLMQSNRTEIQSAVTFKELITKPYSTPLLVVVLMLICQQTSGMIVINANAVSIFQDFGAQIDPAFCTIMIAVINIIVTLVGAEVHSRYDRKQTLMVSTMFVVNILCMLGLYYMVLTNGGNYTAWAEGNRHIPVVLLLLYSAAHGLGLGPIPYMYLSEGLPTNIRGPATGIAMTISTIVIVMILMSFNVVVASLGYTMTFVLMSAVTTIIAAVVLSHMQETRGLSISDVDSHYEKLKKDMKRRRE